jgi:hypothetical protein
MIKTKQRTRKQIANLSLDIEIVNLIESKALFGGCTYQPCDNSCRTYGGWQNGTPIFVYGTSPSYNPHDTVVPIGFGPGGSGGGGEGGGSSGGGSAEIIDLNNNGTDDSQERKYDKHICKQFPISATCAPISLGYVANYYGAVGLTASDFAEMVGYNYSFMFAGIQDGLTPQQLATIMSSIFQSTQISTYEQIASNANNGIPVLATINVGTSNGGNTIIGHEVVITGLNTTSGEMTYMDSITGGIVTTNLLNSTSPISFIGTMYAVEGIKNNPTVDQYRLDIDDVSHCNICGR